MSGKGSPSGQRFWAKPCDKMSLDCRGPDRVSYEVRRDLVALAGHAIFSWLKGQVLGVTRAVIRFAERDQLHRRAR